MDERYHHMVGKSVVKSPGYRNTAVPKGKARYRGKRLEVDLGKTSTPSLILKFRASKQDTVWKA